MRQVFIKRISFAGPENFLCPHHERGIPADSQVKLARRDNA